jgi:Tfp pilus assembly protein PilO
MKRQDIILVVVILSIFAVFAVDRFYVSSFETTFAALEKQRIVTSNQLTTAKIVYENLNHVRDLVFKNMNFPGQRDTFSAETRLFDFITTCVNDLKLKLVSLKPQQPVTEGRITTYPYEVELEGDFFTFGELCSKFENSRRIISIEVFEVNLLSTNVASPAGKVNKRIRVRMHINTFRIKKG